MDILELGFYGMGYKEFFVSWILFFMLLIFMLGGIFAIRDSIKAFFDDGEKHAFKKLIGVLILASLGMLAMSFLIYVYFSEIVEITYMR